MTSPRANRVKGKVIFSISPQFSVALKGFLPWECSSPHLQLPVPILTQPSLAFLTPQPSSAATSWNSTQPSFIGTNPIHHPSALIATTSSNPQSTLHNSLLSITFLTPQQSATIISCLQSAFIPWYLFHSSLLIPHLQLPVRFHSSILSPRLRLSVPILSQPRFLDTIPVTDTGKGVGMRPN